MTKKKLKIVKKTKKVGNSRIHKNIPWLKDSVPVLVEAVEIVGERLYKYPCLHYSHGTLSQSKRQEVILTMIEREKKKKKKTSPSTPSKGRTLYLASLAATKIHEDPQLKKEEKEEKVEGFS